MKLSIRLATGAAAIAALAHGEIRNITPADHLATVVAEASDGDEIVLAAGTYVTSTVEINDERTITLRAAIPEASVEITFAVPDPTVDTPLIRVGERSELVLEDVTLRGANGEGWLVVGEALSRHYVDNVNFLDATQAVRIPSSGLLGNSFARFRGCRFELAPDGVTSSGNAIRADEAQVEVVDCRFVGNERGILAIFYSAVSVTDSEFRNNRGGAIEVQGDINRACRLSVGDSSFVDNGDGIGFAGTDAGAIYSILSELSVARCHFEGNKGGGGGRAVRAQKISIDPFPVQVDACTFYADGDDRVVLLTGVDTVSNNLFFLSEPSPLDAFIFGVQDGVIANNTFVAMNGDAGPDAPRAIFADSRFDRSVIANNVFVGILPLYESSFGYPFAFINNNIFGLEEPPDPVLYSQIVSGNTDEDPMFIDPEARDFRLGAGSQLIDRGASAWRAPDHADLDADGDTFEPVPFDALGRPRVFDGDADGIARVDIGAFEFNPTPMVEPCPADLALPTGVLDMGDVVAFLNAFGAGCP